jgi:hypothetical protein
MEMELDGVIANVERERPLMKTNCSQIIKKIEALKRLQSCKIGGPKIFFCRLEDHWPDIFVNLVINTKYEALYILCKCQDHALIALDMVSLIVSKNGEER